MQNNQTTTRKMEKLATKTNCQGQSLRNNRQTTTRAMKRLTTKTTFRSRNRSNNGKTKKMPEERRNQTTDTEKQEKEQTNTASGAVRSNHPEKKTHICQTHWGNKSRGGWAKRGFSWNKHRRRQKMTMRTQHTIEAATEEKRKKTMYEWKHPTATKPRKRNTNPPRH